MGGEWGERKIGLYVFPMRILHFVYFTLGVAIFIARCREDRFFRGLFSKVLDI